MASEDITADVAEMASVEEEQTCETEEMEMTPDREDLKMPNSPDLGQATVTVETETPDRVKKGIYEAALVYNDDSTNVSYEIQPGSSKRGRDKLIDSLGFTYNCKPNKNSKTVTWTCAIRNAKLRCPATVIQRGEMFMRGLKKHKHFIGQSLPKPGSEARQTLDLKLKQSRRQRNVRSNFKGNQDYKIIKNGSKSGMDLLKDCLGYTYTFKRTTSSGFKTYWSCSVRNKHLRCAATIIQYGEDKFYEGPHLHQHLPAFNIPADDNEDIPSLRKYREEREEEESDFDESEIVPEKMKNDEEEHSYGSTYMHSGKSSAAKRKAVMAKEKKRKDHPTFLGPMCTINLSKCDDSQCNCGLVHCPFCDPEHFKPTKAGRVQDHLEMTHFAHGVQYDDLMIVKCFKDCDADRHFGHYHCVFCSQQIIKRDFYARHMLRHLRTMGIPERLLMLPDSKYPDIINAYGYEIPICLKTTCMSSGDKHFHCPCCSQVCVQRSLTVNHLWRCFQKQQGCTDDFSDEDETQYCNTVDEDQIMLHFSHAKTIKDMILEKCAQPNCCNGKYHCALCPTDTFLPSYKQQLVAHYILHWKSRVYYKNYGLMRCFQGCQESKLPSKIKYHYHCPICTKTIQSRATFEEHLKSCHMLRFGENLIDSLTMEDESLEESASLKDDPTIPIQENVEFLEDQLIAQAQAYTEKQRMERLKIKKEKVEEKRSTGKASMFRKPIKREGTYAKNARKAHVEEADVDESYDVLDTSGPIDSKAIFQTCTAVLTRQCMQTIRLRKDLQTMLGVVSGQTDTNLSMRDDGQYQLTGNVEHLYQAQTLIEQAINKEKKLSVKKEATEIYGRALRQNKLKAPMKKNHEGTISHNQSTTSAKKGATGPVKRGRGRPKKVIEDADTFPYSEIKEIVNATKGKHLENSSDEEEGDVEEEKEDSEKEEIEGKPVARGRGRPRKSDTATPDTVKRGRGRPPKKSPASSIKAKSVSKQLEDSQSTPKDVQKRISTDGSEKKEESISTPATPKRYGTRGLRKDYAGMNSGIGITEIKVEPQDDTLLSPRSGQKRQSFVPTPSKKRKTSDLMESDSTPSKKRKDSELKTSSLKEQEEQNKEEGETDTYKEINDDEDLDDEYVDDDNDDDFQEYLDDDDDDDEDDIDSVNEEQFETDVKDTVESLKTDEKKSDEKPVSQLLQVQLLPNKLPIISTNPLSNQTYSKSMTGANQVYVPLTTHVKPSSEKKQDSTGAVNTSSQQIKEKFQCSHCEKQFSYKSNLDDHENKHTGATPYKCEICSKAFPSQSMLMKHKTMVHTTIRPYKCSVCHKSFRFMNVLQSHMSTHLKPKQHICPKCNRSYSTATTLRFHIPRCKIVVPQHGFTVLNDKDNIVIYTDNSTPPAAKTNQRSLIPQNHTHYRVVLDKGVHEEIPVKDNNTDTNTHYTVVVDKEVNEEMPTEPIKDTPVEVGGSETVYMPDSSVEVDGNVDSAGGELELYACSECNSAFDTYEKAEAHILTAHSVVSG